MFRLFPSNIDGETGLKTMSITGDALIEHVEICSGRCAIWMFRWNPRKFLVRDVMEGVNNFMKSGTLLRQVINKIMLILTLMK